MRNLLAFALAEASRTIAMDRTASGKDFTDYPARSSDMHSIAVEIDRNVLILRCHSFGPACGFRYWS